MENFLKLNTIKSGWSIMYYEVLSGYYFQNVLYCSLWRLFFVFANSAVPAEMGIMWHFTWVLTVYQSTHLGLSGLKTNKPTQQNMYTLTTPISLCIC